MLMMRVFDGSNSQSSRAKLGDKFSNQCCLAAVFAADDMNAFHEIAATILSVEMDAGSLLIECNTRCPIR
jgi:hypothetical protein